MYDGRLTINTTCNILLNVRMSVIFCASANILTDKFIVFVVKLVRKWASNPRIINTMMYQYYKLFFILIF